MADDGSGFPQQPEDDENAALPPYSYDPQSPTPPPAPAYGQQPWTVGGPAAPVPQPPKQRRWGLIIAALVVFCFLPLGGCLALIGFGVSEVSERNDAIRASATDFFAAATAGDLDAVSQTVDGVDPCLGSHSRDDIVLAFRDVSGLDLGRVSFVERDGNSTFSSNADSDNLVIPGRPGVSAATIEGSVVAPDGGVRSIFFLLSKPGAEWRVCQVEVS